MNTKSRKSRRRSRSKSKSNSVDKIILQKSSRPDKKYMVTIGNKTIHFGASGYQSYEVHKDPVRKERYENRHKKRENWTKTGIKTAGFWSKNILWNKPSLRGSIKDTERRFNIKIVYKQK